MPKTKTKRKINSYFYRTIRKKVNSILHLQHLNNDNDNTDASSSNTNNVECLKHINIDDTSNTYINVIIRILPQIQFLHAYLTMSQMSLNYTMLQ